MRCENCTLLCIKWPLTPAKREGYLKSHPSCGFSCSPVQGGTLLRDPGLVLIVSTYIVFMEVLKSPESQLSKTFFGLKIS